MNNFIAKIYREFLIWDVEIVSINAITREVFVRDGRANYSPAIFEWRKDIANFFLKYATKERK